MHYKRWHRTGGFDLKGAGQGEAIEFADIAARSTAHHCIIWPYAKGARYGRVGKKDAHRYVCEIAHGPAPSSEHEAAHRCGVTLCVNGSHVRWATRKENAKDKLLHGTHLKGSAVPVSKFTEDQVREVRRRIAAGERQASIAKDMNMSPMNVSSIKLGKIWGWLE
jgi:hypothetical protein